MPSKKKQAKKTGAKPNAAKGGKVSSSKAKPAEKAGPKAATGGTKATASKTKVEAAKAALAALKAKLNAPKAKPNVKKPIDLAPLKANVVEAKKNLTRAENEGNALRAQAKGTEGVAKKAYAAALAPYRDACRKAGVECEFAGGRAANKTPAVRFLVEKVPNGIKVAIKDKPKSEEVISTATLKKSVGRAAFDYCERRIGPASSVGMKHAGLGNRFRAILTAK